MKNTPDPDTISTLRAALWRARDRMDRARTDAEYEACRQLEIVARGDLERALWNARAA